MSAAVTKMERKLGLHETCLYLEGSKTSAGKINSK